MSRLMLIASGALSRTIWWLSPTRRQAAGEVGHRISLARASVVGPSLLVGQCFEVSRLREQKPGRQGYRREYILAAPAPARRHPRTPASRIGVSSARGRTGRESRSGRGATMGFILQIADG